ncbi:HsdM family class I SAM-dependent methyltransferase [Thermophagus xiamenensis]|uniref:site-specific DNA-methyltransferase (adenine-specific) n=1 Tax=Thermophagus xiamenensis TaxID=385682 RepID=A0A1I1X175_9BACT|nr:N-6 DNA methylase [Thermophagus xiamenensis]SFE01126.1 N-6 DNA Methylase [Thermophagus xiamenensis]
MINKRIINDILKNQDIDLIEKHLVYLFIQNNNLDIEKSPILKKLLRNFEPEPDVYLKLSSLEIKNLKQLENYLELLIPIKDRKVNGAFFTPTYIVDYIVSEVAPKEKDKCLDPSCGCGAFLIGIAEYFKKKFKKPIKNTIKNNIFGADILDYNIIRTKIILSLLGLQNNEVIEETDFNLFCQDSLKGNWTNKFDIVVGNPPYVKYQDLSIENREYLAEKWQTIKYGTFNLYFAFFELGHKLLTPNGKLGYITPNNYFTSLAGLSLRQYFIQTKCLTKIVDFRHKKVFDAQTYTAITFANKKKNNTILYDKIEDSQTCQEFLKSANGSPNFLQELNVKKWRLLKSNEQKNIKIIENIGTPIKNLFDINVGIATLKDEVFFVDSVNEENGYFIKKTKRGIFLIEKGITKPVYKISQFKNQNEIEQNTLRIITPYFTDSKNPIPIPEEEFQIKFPKCYEYLLSEKETLENRDKGKNKYSPFYVWGRTQGITKFGKKILTPTFSKHPRFLFVSEEDAYFTNGYGIFLKKDKSQSRSLFDTDTHHKLSKEENILIVQKILNSFVMDYYIRMTSVSIQGGFPCYQKNFIEKFTIPDFSKEEIEILKNLTIKEEIDEFLISKYQIKIESPNLFS